MKKIIAAAMALISIALSESAIAEFRGYSELNSAGRRRFIFEGLPPSSTTSVRVGMWFFDKTYKANACGLVLIKMKPTQTFTSVADSSGSDMGIPFSYAGPSLPTQTIPTCLNGQLSEPRTQPFKSSEGTIVLVGQSPLSSLTLRVMIAQEIAIKTNQCGMGRLLSPKENPTLGIYNWRMSGFNFNQETYSGEQATGNSAPPICKKIGNDYVLYRKS